MQELKEGEALINFTGTLRTRATKKHYLCLIQRYAAYRKTLDLDQIIEEDSKNQRLAVACIREFLLSIQKSLSPGSLTNYRAALKHFYEMNDITLNWKKISKFARMEDVNAGLRQNDRAYTREEIQLMLQHSSPKVRAIILLLASSGMRVGAVHSTCLKHLTKIKYDNTVSIYQLLVYPGHKDQYVTFCTPEAAAAVDSYLNFRSRAGEKLSPDSPLFRKEFYAADLFKVRNDIVPMTTWGVSGVIRLALQDAGLISTMAITIESERKVIRHDVQRNHGFRKFANTQMILAGVNGAAKEMLLGHSIGLDDKYYRPTPAQLLEEYKKAIDLLTINEENRLRKKVEESKDKEYLMKGRLQDIEREIQLLNQRDSTNAGVDIQKKLEDRDKQILDLRKKLELYANQEREMQDAIGWLSEKTKEMDEKMERLENKAARASAASGSFSELGKALTDRSRRCSCEAQALVFSPEK